MSHAACRHSLSPTAAACLPWTPRIRSAHRVGCFVAMVVARFIRGPREPTVARAVRSMDTSAYSRRRAVRSVASDPTWTLKRLRAKRGAGTLLTRALHQEGMIATPRCLSSALRTRPLKPRLTPLSRFAALAERNRGSCLPCPNPRVQQTQHRSQNGDLIRDDFQQISQGSYFEPMACLS
jgi:hypothetical protein